MTRSDGEDEKGAREERRSSSECIVSVKQNEDGKDSSRRFRRCSIGMSWNLAMGGGSGSCVFVGRKDGDDEYVGDSKVSGADDGYMLHKHGGMEHVSSMNNATGGISRAESNHRRLSGARGGSVAALAVPAPLTTVGTWLDKL
ncbi:hypothetical protein Drorol1_Dr00020538 [Drosera rotundifolia]